MSYVIELKRHIHYETLESFDSSGLLFSIQADHFQDNMTDYFLSSPHLNVEQTANIAQKAEDFGILINGIFEIFEVPGDLQLGSHRLLQLDPLQHVSNICIRPPSPDFFMPYSGLCEGWPYWKRFRNRYRDHETGNFCLLCLCDASIRNIALTLGYLGVNWISLSSAIEHIGYSESEMSKRYKIDLSEIKLLKRTANSFGVLGPAARHGEKGFEPPKEPMSLSKAKTITLAMIRTEAAFKSKQTFFQQFVGRIFCE